MEKKLEYNILSPDGIEIRQENFKTFLEAWEFFDLWKTRFVNQGYYSSNRGRILLEDLRAFCIPVIIDVS